MTKRIRATSWAAMALIACVAITPLFAAPAVATATAVDSVKVTVKYTGKGVVDQQHKLWIWLFDTPDIGPGSIPIAELSLDQNGGVASFEGVIAGKVWIVATFDANGGFGGGAPPPPGSPVGLYGADSGGAPAPVDVGANTAAALTFDDSIRMPASAPKALR